MKLGLSGRIIENADGFEMNVYDFLKFTAETGYRGVELRYRQLSDETTLEEAKRIRKALDDSGLGCAFTTAIGVGNDESFDRLKRAVERALIVNAGVLRVSAETTEWYQKTAEYSAMYNLRIAYQMHTGSKFENIDKALATLKEINRKNFGLTYEPLNLMVVGEDYGPVGLKRLGDCVFNVSVQNMKKTERNQGDDLFKVNGLSYERCVVGDSGGVDFNRVFKGLKEIGYNGYVTLIDPPSPFMNNLELARYDFKILNELLMPV